MWLLTCPYVNIDLSCCTILWGGGVLSQKFVLWTKCHSIFVYVVSFHFDSPLVIRCLHSFDRILLEHDRMQFLWKTMFVCPILASQWVCGNGTGSIPDPDLIRRVWLDLSICSLEKRQNPITLLSIGLNLELFVPYLIKTWTSLINNMPCIFGVRAEFNLLNSCYWNNM